jgi:hypothetical protein
MQRNTTVCTPETVMMQPNSFIAGHVQLIEGYLLATLGPSRRITRVSRFRGGAVVSENVGSSVISVSAIFRRFKLPPSSPFAENPKP